MSLSGGLTFLFGRQGRTGSSSWSLTTVASCWCNSSVTSSLFSSVVTLMSTVIVKSESKCIKSVAVALVSLTSMPNVSFEKIVVSETGFSDLC